VLAALHVALPMTLERDSPSSSIAATPDWIRVRRLRLGARMVHAWTFESSSIN